MEVEKVVKMEKMVVEELVEVEKVVVEKVGVMAREAVRNGILYQTLYDRWAAMSSNWTLHHTYHYQKYNFDMLHRTFQHIRHSRP